MSIGTSIVNNFSLLVRIEQNLRKSINKNIQSDTLHNNLESAIDLFQKLEYELIENQDKIPDVQLFSILKKARHSLDYIKQVTKSKIATNHIPIIVPISEIMAFDAKLASSILLPFDGDCDKLSAFVDSVKFLKQ